MQRIGSIILLAVAFAGCGSKSSQTTTQPATQPTAPTQAGTQQPAITSLATGAMLFDDLGTHTRKVTTKSPEAQRYFDQGLRLLYGFNHDEAARSFAKAFEIDPSCAMCAWGVAYALG